MCAYQHIINYFSYVNYAFQRRPSQLITNFCTCLTQNSSLGEFPFSHQKNSPAKTLLVPAKYIFDNCYKFIM